MAVRIETHAEPIPGYRLIERIGGGGFGEVWKCEAPGGLHKAIKFVFGNLDLAGDSGQRAEQELKALSRVKAVRHPYILSLERFDIIDGQLLIVMELADRNLWDRFKESRNKGLPGIPRDELLRYMEESAEALDLMNIEYQLQHLDIKPQNLFLVHNHVKVADFGLVKDFEGSKASVTGGITPVYAAPETFDGVVSRYSDQYSLGIVYQELLTGQRPFQGNNVRQLILQHLQAEPNLSSLEECDRPAIARALSKSSDARYPTCRDMVSALVMAGMPPNESDAYVRGSGHYAPVVRVPGVPRPANTPAPEDTQRVAAPGHQPPPAAPAAPPPWRVPEPRPPSAHGEIAPGVTRSLRPAGAPPREHPLNAVAPNELQGDGALLPALVIGLGGLGGTVIRAFRDALAERFGAADAVAPVRTLVLDTDGDALRAATLTRGGSPYSPLPPHEAVLVPLQRPSYYIKPREGRPPVDEWLNLRLVYRIPREQTTAGVRALGRLALVDNFRLVRRRLIAELQSCLDIGRLEAAARATGLGLRTNRPRIYLLAGLMGGTGGGMFLDLAYLTRDLLRQMGYDEPDVAGLLLVPELGSGSRAGGLLPPHRAVPVGNACAALAELHHYGDPSSTFYTRFSDRELPLSDSDPPFTRCLFLPVPHESDRKAAEEVVGMAAQFLLADTCSLVGRTADEARAKLTPPPWPYRGQYYQSFGLYRLSFPRREVVRRAAAKCLRMLVEHWMSKDARPLGEAVREWAASQWQGEAMAAEHFITRVRDACEKRLGKSPDIAFADALSTLDPDGNGLGTRTSLNPEDVTAVLQQLEHLVGIPGEDEAAKTLWETAGKTDVPEQGVLLAPLKEAAEAIATEWSQKLAVITVRLIEQPAFRLAGAEEAVRQIVAAIEVVLERQEPLAKELAARAAQAHQRLRALLAMPPDGRSWPRKGTVAPADVAELLHCFSKWRYQGEVLRQVASVYISLRGHLTDELREINFCRNRLKDLMRALDEEAAGAPAATPGAAPRAASSLMGRGRHIFPVGCVDVAGAVDLLVGCFDRDALLELDTHAQKMIKGQFSALVQVCLSSTNVTKNLAVALRRVTEDFIATRLGACDAARLFLARHGEEDADDELLAAFEEAVPEPPRAAQARGARPGSELVVLGTPPTPEGEELRDIARRSLPDVSLAGTDTQEDFVFYREWSALAVTDLDQLGPPARDAYQQMRSTEHFPPHNREDVSFTLPNQS